jgi:hypothetical protein
MKMSKKFLVVFLTFFTIVLSGFASATTQEVIAADELIESSGFELEDLEIKQLAFFIDENVDGYNLQELQNLILVQKDRQLKAHNLAQNARMLNWPENSKPVKFAKIEWHNSQLKIDFYQNEYDKKYESSEEKKWAEKEGEYYIATKTWRYMKSLGWNDYVCAGIMGNLMTETGGQTLYIKPNASGNGYYGICQWNSAYKNDVWGADLQGQLNYLGKSIKYQIDTYGYAYRPNFNFNSFLELNNEKDAALAFAKCYERCGSGSYNVRQNNATFAYNYFVN